MSYTVNIVPGEKFTKKTWETIEKNQHNDHNRLVIGALMSYDKPFVKGISSLVSLPDSFYLHLYKSIILKEKSTIATPKPDKKNKISKSDIIKYTQSIKKINSIIDDIAKDIKNNKFNYYRYLKNEIIEVRLITLIYLLVFTKIEANEIDIIVQKFLKSVNEKYCDFIDRTKTKNISELSVSHLKEELEKFRKSNTFNGIHLAISNPKIFWKTSYDMCLPDPPIKCRKNQQETLDAIKSFIDKDNFLVVNKSPPGSGKSTLIVPIVKLYNNNNITYICAGQGKTGVIQFMQALYGASIPFANMYLDGKGNLAVDHNRLVKDKSKCKVYVGTPDSVTVALKNETLKNETRDEKFSGIVIVDEPTYGADIQNSPACDQLMKLIYNIPKSSRKLVLLSATLPSMSMLPSITENYTNIQEISGSDDSIQLTCDIVSSEGDRLMPHYMVTNKEIFKTVADKIKIDPLLSRFYSARNLIEMSEHFKIPISLDNADDFKPDKVKEKSILLLETLNAGPDIETPMKPQRYEFSESAYMTMVVTLEPTKYALNRFSSIIEDIKVRYGSAAKIYQNYMKLLKQNEKLVEIQKRQKKQDDQEREEGETIDLGFSNEFQINTKEYCLKHGIELSKYREYVNISLIQHTDEIDELQILLMAGVGVLSNESTSDSYKDQVMNLMTDGRLAYVITDHTGCYGVNMLVNTVQIEPDFASLASIQTIEQAGGRLCRVGLTYSGTLILPEFKIQEMFDNIKNPHQKTSIEAENMEIAYNKNKLKV